MKIFISPFYKNNPYQQKVINELALLGVEVNIAETGAGAFFRTKGIEKADVIHFHWFEPFIKSNSFVKSLLKGFLFLMKLYFFKKKKKFVWTVHNLVNHEKKNAVIDKLFVYFFLKMIDNIHVHNKYTTNKLLKLYRLKENKVVTIAHGNYIYDYPEFTQVLAQFKTNTIKIPDKFTFTFLGNIRPYKGVLDLVEAFKKIKNKNCQLLICGHVTNPKDIELINDTIVGYSNIYFKPGFVADNHIQGYIKSSDVMIYPYKDILTSGSLILGMSLQSACLVSNVGSMAELIQKDFVFNNMADLVNKMDILSNKSSTEIAHIGDANFKKIEASTWLNMALNLKDIYLNLRSKNNG